jgi:hypothetical protein
MMHLISTRGFPCPTKEMMMKSLAEHQLKLRTPAKPVPVKRQELLYSLSYGIALKVNKGALTKLVNRAEHISLTNSSCFEQTRESGGRAKHIQDLFHVWCNKVADQTFNVKTIFGSSFVWKEGQPRWKAYSLYPLTEEEETKQFGEVFDSNRLFGGTAGFNKNLGFQIYQMAAEAAIDRGVLSKDYKVIGRTQMRASSLGEGGGKSRTVTTTEWWATILLQPLGHILVSTLKTLEESRAGLTGAEPAWEFIRSLQRRLRDGKVTEVFAEDALLLTADLECATDNCNPVVCRKILQGYLAGLGPDFQNPILLMSVDLLVSPRTCVWRS